MSLRAVGLCGADDSVHPNMLGLISQSYPFVEFGVLFRPDQVSLWRENQIPSWMYFLLTLGC